MHIAYMYIADMIPNGLSVENENVYFLNHLGRHNKKQLLAHTYPENVIWYQ